MEAMTKTPFQQYSQFYKPADTEQKPDQVVSVNDWSVSELETYPEGARDKAVAYAPKEPPYPFLLPQHKYLLKRSYRQKNDTILYEQFWNEIVAYKLGRAMHIKVPPAFVAVYSKDMAEPYYGSLIEWFYDYTDVSDNAQRGGEVVKKYDPLYDTEKGERHNFQLVSTIFEEEHIENWLEEWAGILLFDAIIGNTDRHQDNWQIIEYAGTGGRVMSPAFDNGTSMGYNFRNDHLASKLKELDKYACGGTHHMKWELPETTKLNHFAFLKQFLQKYPSMQSVVAKLLAHDITPALDRVQELTTFTIDDDRYRLKPQRADFIVQLITHRHNKAKQVCNHATD